MTSEPLLSVDAALRHLRGADAVLARVIDQVGPYTASRRADPYVALIRPILYQQLAGAAAAAIERRFYALYDGGSEPPRPGQLLASTDAALRAAGISRQKAAYLRDLALHVAEGRLDFDALASLDDEAVMQRITAVRGLGEWSAHMFLMFHLGRPGVLPGGGLGVRPGRRMAHGLP